MVLEKKMLESVLLILDMSFSLSLHFLPVLSLQISVCHNEYKIVFSILITLMKSGMTTKYWFVKI